MATVIDQILSIDSIAQKKLNSATELTRRLREETDAKAAEIAAGYAKRAEDEIGQQRAREQKRAEEEKNTLSGKNELAISRLEAAYQQMHAKLEEDIFQNIIRGDMG